MAVEVVSVLHNSRVANPKNELWYVFCLRQSIVMPIYNASEWLEEALQSVLQQSFTGSLELSVFNDGSTVSISNDVTISLCVCYQ